MKISALIWPNLYQKLHRHPNVVRYFKKIRQKNGSVQFKSNHWKFIEDNRSGDHIIQDEFEK